MSDYDCDRPSTSLFIAQKILLVGFAVAFASYICQSELYTGQCGLVPSPFHPLYLVLSVTGFLTSVMGFFGQSNSGMRTRSFFLVLSAVHLTLSYSIQGFNLSIADRILVEAGITVGVFGNVPVISKVFLFRVLVSVSLSKFMDINCDKSWLTFSSLKADALNQPFPFTSVWHLAQATDSVAEAVSTVVVFSESVLPMVCALSRRFSPFEQASLMGILGLTLYYSAIGNFNWSILVVVSVVVSLLSEQIVTCVFGVKFLGRWGHHASVGKGDAESLVMKSLKSVLVLGILLIVTYYGVESSAFRDLVYPYLSSTPVVAVVCLSVFIQSWFSLVKTRKWFAAAFTIMALMLSGNAYLSLITFGYVQFVNDYTSLPTCYSFSSSGGENMFPVHGKKGRLAFLFQTRYSEIGTNTVGSNLGGTRYAELALRGSVHGDEERPPFLIGHFPRLALALWKMGTGNIGNIREGIAIIDHIDSIVRSGSADGIKVFFPDANPAVVAGLVNNAKPNPVQAFYQLYEVTHRAADHQWWKRSHEEIAKLPSSEIFDANLKACKALVPGKVFNVHTENILILGFLGMFVLRLLLSGERVSDKRKRK